MNQKPSITYQCKCARCKKVREPHSVPINDGERFSVHVDDIDWWQLDEGMFLCPECAADKKRLHAAFMANGIIVFYEAGVTDRVHVTIGKDEGWKR